MVIGIVSEARQDHALQCLKLSSAKITGGIALRFWFNCLEASFIMNQNNEQLPKLSESRPGMSKIQLDPRLREDCHLLGCLGTSELLLMRNALFPWFVLVPQTDEIEFHQLEPTFQTQIIGQVNLVAEFIGEHYPVDKMNIGMLGNIVSQLHIHVIGRNRDDICWPGVVWGVKTFKPYQPEQVDTISKKLVVFMPDSFRANPEMS